MRLARTIAVALVLCAACLGPVRAVSAQTIAQVRPIIATASLTTTTCTGSGLSQAGCVGVNLGGYKSVTVQLFASSWAGTITFEVSVDGVNWVSQNMLPASGTQTAVTTATANGVWAGTVQGAMFRARYGTATTPPVTVTIRATL